MSFTQENKVKVGKCNGCEKRCEFGVKHEEIRTSYEGKIVLQQVMRPSLGGQAISSYQDKIGITTKPGYLIIDNNVRIDGVSQAVTLEVWQLLHKNLLKEAELISHLCDHYKVR